MNLREQATKRIIELLKEPTRRIDLISEVSLEFGIRPGTVKSILFQLVNHGLIRKVGANHIILTPSEPQTDEKGQGVST